MTKLAALFTAMLLLFQSSNIPIADLLELDELVQHYQFHNSEYGDSLIVFLSKHYGELKTEHNRKHREEHQEHEQLPFQQNSQSVLIMAFVPCEILLYDSHADIVFEEGMNFYYSESYSFLWGEIAFEPPRQV